MANPIIKNAYFHHIALKVKDFDASLRFYTEGLGFKCDAAWGEGDGRAVLLDIGDGGYIELFAGGKTAAVPEDTAGDFIHLAIGTDDPDGAFARAIEYGCKEKLAPFETGIPAEPAMPVRIAFVTGLDGEVLEFFKTIK